MRAVLESVMPNIGERSLLAKRRFADGVVYL